jgi:hypothetical protein
VSTRRRRPFRPPGAALEYIRRPSYSLSEMGSRWAGGILRRRSAIAVAAAAIAVAAAAAAWAAGSPPEGPQLETMALATTDFARGAAVLREGFQPVSSPVVARFERDFRSGARLNGQRFLGAYSDVDLIEDAGTALLVYNAVLSDFSTAAGRRRIARDIKATVARSTRGLVRVKTVTFGRVVLFQAAQGAFRQTIRLHTNRGTLDVGVIVIVLDRALGVVELDSFPRNHIASSTELVAGRKLAQHFQVAFQIRNVTPPVIVGTARQGATLTADRGHWAGGPSSFTYQWNHCDATGANCAPITGAVAPTYVPGTADAGMRLTVTVTATNSVSSKPVTSAATSPVT